VSPAPSGAAAAGAQRGACRPPAARPHARGPARPPTRGARRPLGRGDRCLRCPRARRGGAGVVRSRLGAARRWRRAREVTVDGGYREALAGSVVDVRCRFPPMVVERRAATVRFGHRRVIPRADPALPPAWRAAVRSRGTTTRASSRRTPPAGGWRAASAPAHATLTRERGPHVVDPADPPRHPCALRAGSPAGPARRFGPVKRQLAGSVGVRRP
jgi:hypothetical protein